MNIYENAKKMNGMFIDNAVQNNTPRIISYPRKITIHLTNRCNYNCIMCGNSKLKKHDLSIEAFEEIKPILPFVSNVTLLGGEPLVYSKVDEILEILCYYGAKPAFITNGSLLTPERSYSIVANGVERITVSIDAARAKTYQQIRRGGNFLKVIKNIANLSNEKIKQGASKPRITFNYVAMLKNINEFKKAVVLAHELGVEQVSGFHILVDNEKMVKESLFFHQQQSNECFYEAKSIGDNLGVKVNIPPLFGEEVKAEDSCKRCIEPWNTLMLQVDGNIRSCCNMEMAGNVLNENFKTLWNNEIFMRYRKTVNTDNELESCRYCHMGMKTPNVNKLETHFRPKVRNAVRNNINSFVTL
mgnify:CR=1 FL=1